MKHIFRNILIIITLFVLFPSISLAITDASGNKLPFDISIPENWVELSPGDIYKANKIAPQTKIIKGYHPRGLNYPRLVIFDDSTPLKKVRNSIEAEELVRIMNNNNFKNDINDEVKNIDNGKFKIEKPIAFYDRDKDIVTILLKNNYGELTLVSETVVFVRDNNPLVLGFYSLENQYQKDSVTFENIKNSVTFSEMNTSDNNNSQANSGFYLTKDDVVSFISWIIIAGIFLIIYSSRREKVNK